MNEIMTAPEIQVFNQTGLTEWKWDCTSCHAFIRAAFADWQADEGYPTPYSIDSITLDLDLEFASEGELLACFYSAIAEHRCDDFQKELTYDPDIETDMGRLYREFGEAMLGYVHAVDEEQRAAIMTGWDSPDGNTFIPDLQASKTAIKAKEVV